ncbi:MAG: LON peptidase substrate-binding domain-containing protein [Sphingomonadales bacterium]|nr:LON peptidase substrate-binding domain-containing protein [Sphingomonadales bacterium]
MFKPCDLPESIPLFPLTGALLLPRGRLPLHIFEPRYLQMIEDCLKTRHRLIGMIQPCKCRGGGNALNTIGCAGRLTGFSETEDGRYMITLSGISRFRLMREIGGFTPYLRAEVQWADFERDMGRAEQDPGFSRARFMDLLGRYLVAQGLDTDWDSLTDAEDELLINSLSMLLPLDPEDKQALLEAPSLETRRETLITLMEFALHGCGGPEEPLQ